jgi:oligosaccharide repeat unit polymerase
MIVFVIFVIIIAFILLMNKDSSIINPAKMFTVIWGGQIIFIAVLFRVLGIFEFSFIFYMYMLAMIIIFNLSYIIGKSVVHQTNMAFHFQISRRVYYMYYTLLILAMIYPLLYAIRMEFSFSSLFLLDDLLETSNRISRARYSSDTALFSKFEQIPLIFVYLVPAYGGYLSIVLSKKEKKHCYLSLLPPLITSIVANAKLGFILGSFLFFSGICVAQTYYNKQVHVQIKKILLGVIVLIGFFSILFFLMLLRTGEITTDTILLASTKFVNYFGGHLPLCDIWLTKNIDYNNYSYGIKTFFGISNFIGIADREQGVFIDSITYGHLNSINLEGNVYTIIRFFIEDFGFLGSLIAVAISGLICGYYYSKTKQKIGGHFSQSILLMIYFFVFFSFLSSPFAYTSLIVAFILFYIIIKYTFENTYKIYR